MENDGELQAMKKLETEWNDYKTTLGKSYDPSENSLRMAIFESNELVTEKINREFEQGLVTFKTSLNDLADLTEDEFIVRNGLRLPNSTDFNQRRKSRQTSGGYYQYNRNEPLPVSVDWRENGFVTPVKNQGECGSCYAFATSAALESYVKMRTGQLIDLSPQNIVDCTWELGNNGCSGGYMPRAFEYARNYGVARELNYPYIESEQRCKWNNRIALARDNGYGQVEPGDELGLKHAVAKRGPVVVGIAASSRAFRFYQSGVFVSNSCGQPDHAVLVVGYGTHPSYGDYWIVKNSWGTGWGAGGYVYMARNRRNMCHIATTASFPI
uniref:Cathepsin L-like n=1 Tax=Elaeophora elaphi TaxID=1147741 RepID=A0A0R3S6I7_9BILA